MELGPRIKQARKAAGLTQQQLAERCGWDPPSRLANYEQGTREPSLADLRLIATNVASSGLSFAWLVTGEQPPVVASQLQRPDPATLSAAVELGRRSLELIGDDSFDPEADGEIVAQAYVYLIAQQQTKITRSNVVDFAAELKRRTEGDRHGAERKRGTGAAGATSSGPRSTGPKQGAKAKARKAG